MKKYTTISLQHHRLQLELEPILNEYALGGWKLVHIFDLKDVSLILLEREIE